MRVGRLPLLATNRRSGCDEWLISIAATAMYGANMSKRILLWSPLDDYVADLLGSLENVDFCRVNSEAEFEEFLPSADALVLLGMLYNAEVAKLVREKANPRESSRPRSTHS
jgi:hypothetical protein